MARSIAATATATASATGTAITAWATTMTDQLAALLVTAARGLLSWKALAILLAVVNLKNAPFAWHARVFYYMFSRMHFKKHDLTGGARRVITRSNSTVVNGNGCGIVHGGEISTHPIFAPSAMLSHTPLTEMDYNFHKSNSTYFSDLDVSRTALVTDIYTPGVELLRRELDAQRDARTGRKLYPGGIFVVLGSVYCSFKKPIVAYERYEMQSRVVGWDDKWLYVVTYFLRPERRKGQGKTLLAVGISEYVTKKGRYTISPAKVLGASGLLPPPPTTPPAVQAGGDINGNGVSTGVDAPGDAIPLPDATGVAQLELEMRQAETRGALAANPEWTWEKIEAERLRGMGLVKQFVGLEAELVNEARL
ncbi:hypothetical protein KEM52_002098 [Ascosphaera acerosa]|nr:hypothetical protein KEM52_002098 [Ascosphaera acerosa]